MLHAKLNRNWPKISWIIYNLFQNSNYTENEIYIYINIKQFNSNNYTPRPHNIKIILKLNRSYKSE